MKAFLVAASLALFVPRPAAQALSPADLTAAIEQGRAGKSLQKKCSASTTNGFEIVIEGPVGRVMRAAREARGKTPAFSLSDVTPAMDGAVLTVSARRDAGLRDPSQPGFEGDRPGRVAYRADIVVRSRPSGVEPLVLAPVGRILHTRPNDGGFAFVPYVRQPDGTMRPVATNVMSPAPGTDMSAAFDLVAFRALPADGLELVVFTSDAGEQRCKISEKDRRDLR